MLKNGDKLCDANAVMQHLTFQNGETAVIKIVISFMGNSLSTVPFRAGGWRGIKPPNPLPRYTYVPHHE